MGFGTQQQLGNRTGVTNQTTLADLLGGGVGSGSPAPGQISPQQPGFGNISPPGLGQDGQQFDQNQLFTLLQSLLGGQGGFQDPGQQNPGIPTRQPPVFDVGLGQPGGGAVKQPPRSFAPPPGKGVGNGQITPIGLGQQLNGFGGTPLNQLSNPFGNLINQRAIR